MKEKAKSSDKTIIALPLSHLVWHCAGVQITSTWGSPPSHTSPSDSGSRIPASNTQLQRETREAKEEKKKNSKRKREEIQRKREEKREVRERERGDGARRQETSS